MTTLFDDIQEEEAVALPVVQGSLAERMPPRDYQAEAVSEFLRAYADGERHMLYRLATGLGKTYTGALTAEHWLRQSDRNRVLVLAYERGLVNQFREELHEFLPGIDVGLEMSNDGTIGRWPPPITCASRQSLYLAKDDSSRLFKFDAKKYNWLIIPDECVSGDAICYTEEGPTRLDSVKGCRQVLSFDGTELCWRRIIKWWDRGERQSLRLRFESGREIECTANHPLYTESGWREAGTVRPGDTVLSISPQERKSIQKIFCQSANVDVGRGSLSDLGQNQAYNSDCTGKHITRDRQRTTWPLRAPSRKRSTGRFSGIRPSCTPIVSLLRRGSARITQRISTNGTSTRQKYFQGLLPRLGSYRVPGLAMKRHALQRRAHHRLGRYTRLSFATGRRGCLGSGLTASATSDWRGGSAMMAVPANRRVGVFTRKVSYEKTPSLLRNSLSGGSGVLSPSIQPRGATTTFASGRHHCSRYSGGSRHTFLDACSTKFDTVVSVEEIGVRRVYDIEVEGTHCFFANGLLVHNCHGWKYSMPSCRHIVDWFEQNPDSAWLGLTATPERGDGVSLARLFGHVCVEMRLSRAIAEGYLVPLKQKFIQVTGVDFSALREVAGDFDEGELDAILSEREQLLSMAVPLLETVGTMRTLVFVPGVNCAKALAATINAEIKTRGLPHGGADYMVGSTPEDVRAKTIDAHQSGRIQFMIVCGLCRAGYNDPGIECVAVFRPTKSRAMAEQMKGRGVRALRGTLKPGMDQAERLAAIAASAKPHCLILDLVGVSGMPEVASTAHLLASGEADEVVERANKNLAEDGNDDTVEEAIGKAKAQIAEEREAARLAAEERKRREQEEYERRAKIRGKVQYQARYVEGGRGAAINAPGPIGDGPTEKQVRALVRMGWGRRDAERLTKRQASAVIGKARANNNPNGESYAPKSDAQGPPTEQQIKVLNKHGIEIPATFEEAGKLITNIKWEPVH